MHLDDPSLKGPAQRALLKGLRAALPDEGQLRRLIDTATRASRRTELPHDADELLQFVRTYLAPPLARVVSPNLVLAMLDDLVVEFDRIRANEPPSGMRLRATARMSSASRAESAPPSPRTGARASGTPFPRLSDSVAKLVRTASTRLRAAGAPTATPPPASFTLHRFSVIVIDADRLARASLARALVTARCDVTAIDSAYEARAVLEAAAWRAVLIVDAQHDGIVGDLRMVLRGHPELPVLGLTSAPPDATESLLATAGASRCVVMSKGAPMAEVVDAVRRLGTAAAEAWDATLRRSSEPDPA